MPALKQPRVAYNVAIILNQYRITGNVHIHPGQRLSDFINGVKDFLPLTNAQIYKIDSDNLLSSMNLLEVNVHHILLMYPLEGQNLPSEDENYEEADVSDKPVDQSLKSMYIDPFKNQ